MPVPSCGPPWPGWPYCPDAGASTRGRWRRSGACSLLPLSAAAAVRRSATPAPPWYSVADGLGRVTRTSSAWPSTWRHGRISRRSRRSRSVDVPPAGGSSRQRRGVSSRYGRHRVEMKCRYEDTRDGGRCGWCLSAVQHAVEQVGSGCYAARRWRSTGHAPPAGRRHSGLQTEDHAPHQVATHA